MDDQPIVFVFGPERCGTSIMYFALRQALGLTGKGEGHVMPIFADVIELMNAKVQAFSSRNGSLASHLVPQRFRKHVIEFVRQFYTEQYGPGNWVDKTPGLRGMRSANLVREAFPNAKLILMRRTGTEAVESFRRKFNAEFERACHVWATAMKASAELEAFQSPATLKLDQFDLTNNTPTVTAQIAAHLGRPASANKLTTIFSERRSGQTSTHDWQRRVTLKETPWTAEQKEMFMRICGRQMAVWQYPV